MTEQEARKGGGGGGKLSRSETVTVRLDPKLRYLAELAARLHRRTLSSYVEWAIEGSLDNNVLKVDTSDGRGVSIKDEAEYLWDVDDADRFAKLALRYPHLLTHEEQVRWKLITENGNLWRSCQDGPENDWIWTVQESSLLFERLRENWVAICEAANPITWTRVRSISDLAPFPRAKPASESKESTRDKPHPESE